MEASPVQRGGSSGQLGPPSASLRPEAFTHVELSRGCYLGPWGGEATVLCQPKPKEQSKPKGSILFSCSGLASTAMRMFQRVWMATWRGGQGCDPGPGHSA